jgi:light-regulated signal transduction histidine kinase (bacteriophytochrome)
MKLLAPLIITGSLVISAHAVTTFANLSGNVWTETQTLTQSVTSLTSSFVFDQFDPALGTLTGISLSILESDDSGSFTVDATTNLRVKNPTDFITLYDTQSSGAAYTGSGIGLYVVTTTVENHHGQIALSQSPLGGAEVRLNFPCLCGKMGQRS